MAQPVISIVMPLYNKEREVVRAVTSVQRQTISDWALTVVDDGSTDSGADLVLAIQDPRVRVLRQANGGVGAARNAGVRLTQSQFVAFLDADDEWDADMLETLLGLRGRFPEARVLATKYRIRHSGDVSRDAIIRGLPPGFDTGLLEPYFSIAARSDPPICSSSVAVDRSVLESIGGFPAGVAAGEDLVTWARLAARFPVAYAHTAHATFWAPTDTSDRPGRRPSEPDAVAPVLAGLRAPGLDAYLAQWHRMRGVHYLNLGEAANARGEFVRAIRANPRSPILWALLAIGLVPGGGGRAAYLAFKSLQRR